MATMPIRCFIAVDVKLDPEGLAKYQRLSSQLVSTGALLKLVEPRNLHVTLKFLGEIDEVKLERVNNLLRDVRGEAFKLTLRGVGGFPNALNPRVVWIAVSEGFENLRRLRDDVEERLASLFPREGREFKAHVTIARVKRGGQALAPILRAYGNEVFGSMSIKEFKLKRSVLTSEGPIYSDIEVYPLGQPG